MKPHHFILKEDGNIYVIPEMPEKPKKWNYQAGGTGYMDDAYVGPEYYDHIADYEQAIEHAKESAILVENQKDVLKAILKSMRIGVPITDGYLSQQVERYLKVGELYPLECGIEVKYELYIPTQDRWSGCSEDNYLSAINNGRKAREVALITFSEPSKEVVCRHRYDEPSIDGMVRCHWCGEPEGELEEPTQEELWDEVLTFVDENLFKGTTDQILWLSENFTITRKQKALTDQKFEIEKLCKACEVVVKGYENDGMEDMSFRDKVFYQACKEALEKEK